MNQMSGKDAFQGQVFGEETRQQFAACYPEEVQVLNHELVSHDLLTLEALAKLGTALSAKSVEYNPGDVPIGVAPEERAWQWYDHRRYDLDDRKFKQLGSAQEYRADS